MNLLGQFLPRTCMLLRWWLIFPIGRWESDYSKSITRQILFELRLWVMAAVGSSSQEMKLGVFHSCSKCHLIFNCHLGLDLSSRNTSSKIASGLLFAFSLRNVAAERLCTCAVSPTPPSAAHLSHSSQCKTELLCFWGPVLCVGCSPTCSWSWAGLFCAFQVALLFKISPLGLKETQIGNLNRRSKEDASGLRFLA